MQWWILALLALLPLLQGDSAITQVSPAQNDIPRQEEISNEFSLNWDLDSSPEFVEESSEETSGENAEKPVKNFFGELQWKFGENNWEQINDYNWDYPGSSSQESSGHTTDVSSPEMTVVSTTVPSIKMVSVVVKEPTPIP